MTYFFSPGSSDGDGSMKGLLGGKGANLAEMCRIGLPVPPGFTITTAVCAAYYDAGRRLPEILMDEVARRVRRLERETGKRFGDASDPLLVSVRSGAAVSMPGMMDTVLNLGLTDAAVAGLAEQTQNPRFAYDAYRRLINMYGDVVMGVAHEHFERAFDVVKDRYGVSADTDVPAEGLAELCEEYKRVYRAHTRRPFPQDPMQQLRLAIEAVFKSWQTPRAVRYRQINSITGLTGTAVNVQAMVFGNMGEDSGTGVAFTRNPSTGEDELYGEFLVNAQGEDVVAGIRTPRPIGEMADWNKAVYARLLRVKKTLESHYRDMQDIEFTVERGRLFMLQTRTGKRTGFAAVRIACDLARSRRITRDEALARIPAGDLIQLLLPRFDDEAKRGAEVLATGLPASPGVAVGKPAFTADEAVRRARDGERVILVRQETSPEDIDGMHSAVGILTSTGGMTSHAAVVARGWGKCCVAGAGAISIDPEQGRFIVGGRSFWRDDVISLDGSTGQVMAGEIKTTDPELSGDFETVMAWADRRRRLAVRTNADTPADARRAREFGAQGIGLCRTEHMFFEGDRIDAMREMILAEDEPRRRAALDTLLPYQREDFVGIFTAMDGLPVTVRLLDPPLHEFLPQDDAAQAHLAARTGLPVEDIRRRVAALHEANPMLGHRGCRLAITYPEILEMQVTAIVHAAIDCLEHGRRPKPEIMIPLVGVRAELALLRQKTLDTITRVKKDRGWSKKLAIPVGTMIEIPRACVTADEIAAEADFFSFGTNDLTQLTFGYSRDDINTFLPDYLDQEILPRDPFQTIDRAGVGALVEMAIRKGRAARQRLKIGICGEHGGDPDSVFFCHDAGLDYVSCSPFRVPIARLAAAQAVIRT
ncbi:MAG: pyruvate, phosphate dikinase [Planctomycetota bacterium]|nr:MAG: pyruvate, phosphate dikinase [Planctomycetota bacterium]